jgi:hypothetical protein
VQTGDIIGGKMLTDLQATPSLNNNGDVAFSGIFWDDFGMTFMD